MVSGARMKELLQGAPAAPIKLRFSNKSLSLEAAQILAAYIASTDRSALRYLDMSDVIAGRPEAEALQVLQIISEAVDPQSLTSLDVSDNAVGTKGVESISTLLTGKRLERLWVCNNGMSAEAVLRMAQLLSEDGCPPLQLLHFYNNMSGDAGAVAFSSILRQCPGLTDVRFSATRSAAAGCQVLVVSLAQPLASSIALYRQWHRRSGLSRDSLASTWVITPSAPRQERPSQEPSVATRHSSTWL